MRLRLGPPAPDLKKYTSQYKSEFSGRWQQSSHQQLDEQILRADIVLGADFHAFLQSQKTHLRILRRLPRKTKVVLALECFEVAHQEDLDLYLAGEIDEGELLERVDWEERWGFSWAHYQPLLELAQERGFPVKGVNRYYVRRNARSLHRRDQYSAKQICQIKEEYPDSLIYVIYGDLHLARSHLPRAIDEACEEKPKVLIIHQNSEELYFRLARRGIEGEVEVLRGTYGRYCILGSPPWVKWQSYLMYIEHTYDRDLDEDAEESLDYTDHIYNIIRFIASDFKLRLKLDDVAVYSSRQSRPWVALEEELNATEFRLAEWLIENDRSFFIPQNGLFYLSRVTLNHAATLAGQYIHSKLSDRQRILWKFPADFEKLIWVETVGFFFSKMINHKRKPENIRDLKAQLAAIRPQDKGREPLLLALDQRMGEFIRIHSGRRRRSRFRPRRKESYLEAARILGSMMGERMYLAFRTNRIGADTLIDYLKVDTDAKDFDVFYTSIVRRFESQDVSVALTEAR